MKIHEFGLWFGVGVSNPWVLTNPKEWITAIPKDRSFGVWYDGKCLGEQEFGVDFILRIYYVRRQHLIKLKGEFPRCEGYPFPPYESRYNIGRPLTLEDFEVIPNPDYKGDV